YMQANGVSGTIWAGGPWWNPNYELNIEIDSRNNAPRYPMDVLQNFTNGHIQPYAPDFRIYGDGIASGLLYSYSYSFGGAGAAVDVDPESTDQAQSGRKSFKVTYSLPPDSNANCGMHIEGGFYLTDNIATAGHVLSLNIRGDPGANFELHLQDVTGASGLKVTITDYGPAIGNSWQKYEIPLTDLVNASMDGSDYIERIQMDLLNQDTTQRSFHIDNMKVEGPEYVPETPEPPIAQPDSVERYAGETLTFNTATLLLNDTSPEGRPLFVPGVSSLSSQGASVVLDGDWISYIPPTGMNDTDTFTYSIEDSWRVQATGTVTVRVPEAEGPSSPDHVNLRPDIESGSIRLRFGGIVGATYRIQTSVDLEVWTLLSTLESFGNGMINFTHPGGFLTSKRFYRLIRD
ncbi:MAG: Ig-like domain-containing protein, partial [Kiritimatiellae bacterium]|nr:Ig-like domain-containing protein [Kiritimatiellia bacterium]